LDHGRRHQELPLMTKADNQKYNKQIQKNESSYQKYDNYEEAIEVPFTDAIPSDYAGPMGVPISFLDKYNPDQFEILGMDDHRLEYPKWRGR
jgi:Adenine-specific methyltransferase EcoRI